MVLFCIPCLALLAYFAVASIFIPKYRVYLKEGWICFIDKLKRKRCSVSFDNRMRLALSGWLARRGMVRLARFLNNERNFNITLTVIAIVSTIITIYFIYLYVYFWFNPPCPSDGGVCSV